MKCPRTHNFGVVLLKSIVLTITALLIFVAAPPIFTQSTDTFKILQLLQNEADLSIVAFNIQGTFEENDVVNIHSNGVFIKAKSINTPDLAGTHEIAIGNISLDVFKSGDNQIIASIERDGEIVAETNPFQLTIQEQPGKPTITVLVNKEKSLIAVDVTSNFEENDTVKVFLNGVKIREKIAVLNEAQKGAVRISGIQMSELRIGENFFRASILREGSEGEKSDQSEKIIVEEKAETTEEIPEEITVMQCVEYINPQKVTADGGDARDGFGVSVDVKDGVFAVGTKTEKAYIHNKSASGWLYPTVVFEQELLGSGSINRPTAIYNSNIVFMADPSSGYRARSGGAVYVYNRLGTAWVRNTTIAPYELGPYEEFGTSIAVDDHTLAVGAPRPDRSGAVYVYTRTNAGTWSSPIRILPEDTKPGQNFGHSISINRDHIAIGAPEDGDGDNGAVYVYTKSTGGWTTEKILLQNRRLNAQFGTSVLIDGNTLFVGALRDEQDGGYGSGAVYVYMRYGNTWQLVQKLKPHADDNRGKFGAALAYSDDKNILAVGAPESSTVKDNGGAVYLFVRAQENTAIWVLKQVVAPDEVRRGDEFGADIDFEGTRLFVGAYGRDTEERNAGAVYIYSASVVPCVKETEEDKTTEISFEEVREKTPQTFLEILKEKKDVIAALAANAASLAELLENNIQNIYADIIKKEENIIIYDEDMIHARAQKRAAEKRGIIGPMLPDEVVVQVVESIDELPQAPTEDTVRTRDVVIQETENKLGIVVPVSTRDLHLGDVHEEVYRLQVFLNQNGYLVAREGNGSPGNETSTFTPSTDRALRSFQLVNGLSITGMLDKQTRDEIITYITK